MKNGSRSVPMGVRAAAALASALLLGGCADSPQARIEKMFAWRRFPTEARIERIRALLQDPDADVRAVALDTLVTLREPDAAVRADEALADAEASVRAVAAKGLAELGTVAAVPKLVRLLEEDPEASVRRRAADALAALDGDDALAALVAALDDPSRDVRLAAARGSSRVDPVAALETLARVLLDDPDWEVRVAAARGLGRAGRSEAMAALEAAMRDPNEFVRAAAVSAAAEISAAGVYSPSRSDMAAEPIRDREAGHAAY